jgi:AraC-like DNA-binding protein
MPEMDGPPDDFGLMKISEHALRPAARFDSWRQILCRKLLHVSGDPIADEPYWANARLRILPDLRTGIGEFAASRFSRTKQIVAAGDDDFVLMINLTGKFSAAQRGRKVDLEEGDAYLMACAEPGTFVRQTGGALACTRFPARALNSRVPGLYDRVAHRIPKDREVLTLILAYIRTLDDLSLVDPQLRSTVVTQIHDLVALALNPTHENVEEAGASVQSGRLAAIKVFVENNLRRHGLSVRDVAARHGLSPRQVQRLFESEGRTFSQFVLHKRLAMVYRKLADMRFRDRNIGDIALECGFGDLSTFTRAFRAHFGETPRDVRNREPERGS